MMFGGQPYKPPEKPVAEAQLELPLYPPSDLDLILQDPVLQWRCKNLLDAGMTLPQARKLALDNRVDLHFVLYRLIGRGCAPDIAFDIASA